MSKRFTRAVDGILLLDKPQGMSSNTALQRTRGVFGAIKAGHAGSLDPLATGMLPICFGQATKVCGYLLNSRKTYRVAALLGIKTDSADADGVQIEQQPVPAFDKQRATEVLNSFLGAQQQVPPMYSALKHQGQRLYELARSGVDVERAPRDIFIERIEWLNHSANTLEFEVRCSKGTYIRSLVEDVAVRLGTVAHVTMLRRTQVDPFDAARMVTLEALADLPPAELAALLQPADTALDALPVLQLAAERVVELFHGKPLIGLTVQSELAREADGLWRAYGPPTADGQQFLGIVRMNAQGQVVAERLFPPLPQA
ncbi:MAG: tRNA pseudouridine(55) synthase TruB [Steroidobacteraceae bacterium]